MKHFSVFAFVFVMLFFDLADSSCGDANCEPGNEAHVSCPADCPALSSSVDLTGMWLKADTTNSSSPPPAAGWANMSVPGVITGLTGVGAWLKRDFSLPPAPSVISPTATVHFGGAKFGTQVWLNGTFVGSHLGGYEPFDIAAGPSWQPGQRGTILVRTFDWTATFINPTDPVILQALADSVTQGMEVALQVRAIPRGQVLSPIGGQFFKFGIWDFVNVLVRPSVRVSDAFVKPSVRGNNVTVLVEVENAGSVTASGLSIEVIFFDADSLSKVQATPPVPVADIPATTSSTASLALPSWTGQLWSPSNPKLYYAVVILYQGATRLHELDVRFGFREIWTEGHLFVLNGQRTHILGTATWPAFGITKAQATTMLTQVKAGNNHAIRLHTQPWQEIMYDTADELGVLIIEEAALWCDGGGYAVSNPTFWANYQEHARRMAHRDRNHPSVIIWSLENELHSCSQPYWNLTDFVHQLARISDVVRAEDPTRLITYESDWDPEGKADVLGCHYPREFPDVVDFPNAGDFLLTDPSWRYMGNKWNVSKPLYIGEFAHVFGNGIDIYAAIIGQDAYALGYSGARNKAKAALWRWQIESYRVAGVSGIAPYSEFEDAASSPLDLHPNVNEWYQAAKDAFTQIRAFLRNSDSRFFSGTTVKRTAVIVNDALAPASVVVSWSLGGSAPASRPLAIQAAGSEVVNFTVTVPTVSTRTLLPFVLTVALDNGTVLHSEERTYAISPRFPIPSPARKVGIFDPVGLTKQLLQAEGIAATTILDLSALPDDVRILLIGADALASVSSFSLTSVINRSTSNNTLHVVIFEQSRLPALPVPMHVTPSKATLAFITDSTHPVVSGLGENDMKFWASDNYLSRNAIRAPPSCSLHTIAESPIAGGSMVPVLAEISLGCSRWIVSQLDVIAKFSEEPVARALLSNILSYVGSVNPSNPAKELGVFAQAATGAFLANASISFSTLTSLSQVSGLSGPGVALFSGALAWDTIAASPQVLTDFVSSGGVAVLHNLDGAGFAKVSGPLGFGSSWTMLNVTATSPPLTIGNDPVTAGISNRAMYWELPSNSFIVPRMPHTDVASSLLSWVISAAGIDIGSMLQIPAISFSSKTTGAIADGGTAWLLFMTGTISQNFPISTAGDFVLVIEMRGTVCKGQWPLAGVSVSGIIRDTLSVGSPVYTNYTTTLLGQPAGNATISISFLNDCWDPVAGEDANLYIRNVVLFKLKTTSSQALWPVTVPTAVARMVHGNGLFIIDNINWDTVAPAALSDVRDKASEYVARLLGNAGVQTAAKMRQDISVRELVPLSSGCSTLIGDDILVIYANCKLAVTVSAPTPVQAVITIRGFGTECCGGLPRLNVTVDGIRVASILLGTLTSEYATPAVTFSSHSNLTVAFVNDASNTTADRNVILFGLSVEQATSFVIPFGQQCQSEPRHSSVETEHLSSEQQVNWATSVVVPLTTMIAVAGIIMG